MKILSLLVRYLFLIVGFLSLTEIISAVNVSPMSTDTLSPVIGDSFMLTASMSGAVSGSNYYVKCRIGANSSSLNDGQTFNTQSSKWLDDTGSSGAWIDMPQISVGSDGVWSGTLSCRIKSSSTDESKILFVRACLNASNSCGTSFQSSSSLTLNPIVPTSTPTPIPTSTPTPTPDPSPTPTRTPTPTPAPTNSPTPTETPTSIQSSKSTTPKSLDPESISLKEKTDFLDESDKKAFGDDTSVSRVGSVLGVSSGPKISQETRNANNTAAVIFGFLAAGLGVFALASVLQTLRNHSSLS